MKGYDVTQLEYAKITDIPMEYLPYKDYLVRVKTKLYKKNIVISACCMEHLYDIIAKKGYDMITIRTLND